MKNLLILSIFILRVVLVCADIAPNPIKLKSIMPSEDCKVQMVSETVYANIFKDSSIVECVFNMKNWGQASNIEVGFPEMTFYHWSANGIYGDDISPFIEVYVGSKKIDKQSLYIPKAAKDLQDRIMLSNKYRDSLYHAYSDSLILVYGTKNRDYHIAFNSLIDHYFHVDKNFIDVKLKSSQILFNQRNIPFYVWDVKFKALESVTIKVKYKAPCGMKYRDSGRYFFYILSTGAGWYKSIEKATVRACIMDFDMNKVSQPMPSNYRIDTNLKEYIWDFVNLEPTEDDNIYLEYVIPGKKEGENK